MDIIQDISAIMTALGLPLLTLILFFDSRKRSEAAKAKKEEEEAKKTEGDNITHYAAEWKELYEKKEARVVELEQQQLEDRQRIRDLQEENTTLKLEVTTLSFYKCEKRGCIDRVPPNQYL